MHVATIQNTPPDALALRISGPGEERLLLMLVDGIHAASAGKRRVVLDLDEVIFISAGAIRTFVAHLFDRVGDERIVLACSRRTGRRVLRRWAGSEANIVESVGAAFSHAPPMASACAWTRVRATR